MFYETRLLVTGIVQGVGFRPFCSRLASELELSGSVRNTSDGVEIVLRGLESSIESYIARLQAENPDASTISSIVTISSCQIENTYIRSFQIEKSIRMERQKVLIPPDIATCSDCLEEMFDKNNRRYGYPFINCTNCGPRYSIIKDLPYDRPKTTMSSFDMCRECQAEYTDPADRRYHAQPNACFQCGPRLWLCNNKGELISRNNEAINICCDMLESGNIAAIKGLGGFHLACNPLNDEAVIRLRKRKGRRRKPFALMVKDIENAERIIYLSDNAKKILMSAKRPIVLCNRKKDTPLSAEVAPGQNCLGIMLPYTPLHHLIMAHFGYLIMTSANVSDSPIIGDNREALGELSGIADIFLMHDRDIHMPIDDSVIASMEKKHIIIRRSRGFVPAPLGIPVNSPVILGAGAEMKATFSLIQDKMLFPGQYLGDLKELPTINYYKKALKHFLRLYNLRPKYLAHDMHPQYVSTILAREIAEEIVDTLGVQHHHAHLAACLTENRHYEEVIGVIFDGTGYGSDGTIWGGEFLVGDTLAFTRAGYLLPSTLPGGERSILEPWRYGLSLLYKSFGADKTIVLAEELWPDYTKKIPGVMKTLKVSPVTTSAGRLFDGVSSILNICTRASYEGQAASEMESRAEGKGIMPFEIMESEGKYILDWRTAITWVIRNINSLSVSDISGCFHCGLAFTIGEICKRISRDTGINTVALSGGVWQNRRLLENTCLVLERLGFNVLTHNILSPNDECISVGQAAIASGKWHS